MQKIFAKFSVKSLSGESLLLEFSCHPAGGGENFYLLDGKTYRYDSIKKEIYTIFYGNKMIDFTEVVLLS